ncbi:class I SAM-dependent methyltransferase [Streptomyces turgidiscabies]|uniref:Methyltransferase domain protein n=1 Tax=Streptomyces turgidiscabies (strain Car8) TaxID=698760 RepID=L7F191_STRT8|nr:MULTISPECIES: class I SAM-dependent methyltransferase [Streptomyces]ELP64360.1 methyltransferase domain protein [Streptomyces turgidiscabies Car8]MDX3495482.1 class I SAM-dependent methyltransferase [Streptomyces turgidiscabies]GAQ70169.1 demethylrebeccamycin-D-glucose O-methyltransferase [Streptomyces turgidiscabies]
MTDRIPSSAGSATDRPRLADSAYSSDRDLAARQSIYRWQTPRHDLPGIVAGQLDAVPGGGRVVDVGCGNGTYLRRLRAERPELSLLGLDVSPGILATVPGPVAVADVMRLPLATGSVDAALAMHMLYHVPDIPQAVRELSRVVAPDGLVIASTNSDGDKAELDDLLHRAASDVLGTGREPARFSIGARFSLEKAPAFLGEEFGRVRTIELPSTVTVRDPEPVVAYLASYRAWADQYEAPFDETIERARAIVTDHIARQGAFEIGCRAGILVCRR